MFHQIFLSPQVKPWAIIIYKHGIHELPQELPNDLRVRNLGHLEIPGKHLKFCSYEQKTLENRNETFPVVRYFT